MVVNKHGLKQEYNWKLWKFTIMGIHVYLSKWVKKELDKCGY